MESLLPANKVCEDNVFTGVCLSTEGEVSTWGCLARGVCQGEVSGQGRCVSQHAMGQKPPFWNIRELYERYLLQFKRYFTI